MPLKFAVIGTTGQLARALKIRIETSDHHGVFLGRDALDLSAPPQDIEDIILGLPKDIDAVLLAAAYTAVDKAETDTDLAFAVNGQAPGTIARACQKRDIVLIHISTDYVFLGNASTPYSPEDPTQPVNIYGASKLAGEKSIRASGCHGAILRTSWVFDGQGQNFLNTMLRLAQTRSTLSVVDDQWGRPTYAGHLADAVITAAEKLCDAPRPALACYHVTGSGPITNWAGFAQAIFNAATKQIGHPIKVIPIPTKEFPTPAKRPKYSVMDISLFENTFAHKLPSWEIGLKAALAQKYNKAG